jgi:hypothetical protein
MSTLRHEVANCETNLHKITLARCKFLLPGKLFIAGSGGFHI